MFGDFKDLFIVWCYIFMSSCYCCATTRLLPKGPLRLFMFLPVSYFFFRLPLRLRPLNFSVPTAFLITWLSSFKLLLLAFGTGPLSDPSLSLSQFFLFLSFPINLLKIGPDVESARLSTEPSSIKEQEKPTYETGLRPTSYHAKKSEVEPARLSTIASIKAQEKPTYKTGLRPTSYDAKKSEIEPARLSTTTSEPSSTKAQEKPTYETGLRPTSYYAKKTLFLIFLIALGDYRDKVPRDVVLFLICIYIYVGLEAVIGWFGLLGQALLGTRLDGPFDDPYLSTSLQDFWGRRWNRAASASLRATVFRPLLKYATPLLGRKWAVNLGLVWTFLVSDVMHEILFYYMGRVRWAWGTPLFFLLHGLLVAGEMELKKRVDVKWRVGQRVIGPMIFGFVIFTFMRLVLPELLDHNVDDRMLAEYAAFAKSVKDLGLGWVKMGRNLIARVAAQVT